MESKKARVEKPSSTVVGLYSDREKKITRAMIDVMGYPFNRHVVIVDLNLNSHNVHVNRLYGKSGKLQSDLLPDPDSEKYSILEESSEDVGIGYIPGVKAPEKPRVLSDKVSVIVGLGVHPNGHQDIRKSVFRENLDSVNMRLNVACFPMLIRELVAKDDPENPKIFLILCPSLPSLLTLTLLAECDVIVTLNFDSDALSNILDGDEIREDFRKFNEGATFSSESALLNYKFPLEKDRIWYEADSVNPLTKILDEL